MHAIPTLLLSDAALADIEDILDYSGHAFGATARKRYEALLQTALVDLSENCSRAGVKPRSELGQGLRAYHLSNSKKRGDTNNQVAQPRHVVFFRLTDSAVHIVRLLHESMDFAQHIADV